ncbi:MAG: D-alanine--D-alanine ligase family protein [Spirochaetales bacterium]
MKKVRVVLLFGGISAEHEVSCLSAASILKNLDPQRYEVIPVGVARNGGWYRQTGVLLPLPRVTEDKAEQVSVVPGVGLFVMGRPLSADVVFLITHGVQGEDGRIQGLLDCAGVRYTGSGVVGSALGMDKAFAKQVWQHHSLPVVAWLSAHQSLHSTPTQAAALCTEAVATLGLPLFIKPSNSGSSVGVTKVISAEGFLPALQAAFAVDAKVLVEKAVNGREIEVAVLGSGSTRAFGPGEVVPHHEFYDYDAKYLDPDGAGLEIPAQLDPAVAARILDLAQAAYQVLDCRGFARVDFFVDRETGEVALNEINTLPGFTTISMFPRMVLSAGITYPALLDNLIEQALEGAP